MMDKELYQKVSNWFELHKDELVKDIMRLVRIGSVSNPEAEQKPFGAECRLCMDEMLKIGEEHGFHTENYEYYVGSIGAKEKDWDNMIGFWNHLDVVPVGNYWEYQPFEPILKEHFLIGRGSQDNKGPAIGILYMMQCLRELNIELKHQLCLFVGCDEERGMSDLAYYTAHYKTPKMSMIADSGFPVCYGEKGIIEGRMLWKDIAGKTLLDCGGGSASNMIPDTAYGVFVYSAELEEELKQKNLTENIGETVFYEIQQYKGQRAIKITARGTSKHSAFPEGSQNAIYELAKLVGSLQSMDGKLQKFFGSLAYLSEEYYGKNFQISYQDEVSGKTTCAATVLKQEQGCISLHFNIRYAITDNSEKIMESMTKIAKEQGGVWELERDSAPNYFPKEHPAVDILTGIYNEITGENKESFVMGGGTYARKLPNAFAYGIGGMAESQEDKAVKARLFKPRHGGAHEPDEALNVRLLLEAMKIYTMAVIALNDCSL